MTLFERGYGPVSWRALEREQVRIRFLGDPSEQLPPGLQQTDRTSSPRGPHRRQHGDSLHRLPKLRRVGGSWSRRTGGLAESGGAGVSSIQGAI